MGQFRLRLQKRSLSRIRRCDSYRFWRLARFLQEYAATIHKSQGSEYPAVIIPVLTQHYALLQRNLLYTGVARGKRLVVLVGQRKAIAIAVRNVSGRRRWSKLAEWLRPGPAASRQVGMAS
jgi:exodeoxyribonuclease V alpha subunit